MTNLNYAKTDASKYFIADLSDLTLHEEEMKELNHEIESLGYTYIDNIPEENPIWNVVRKYLDQYCSVKEIEVDGDIIYIAAVAKEGEVRGIFYDIEVHSLAILHTEAKTKVQSEIDKLEEVYEKYLITKASSPTIEEIENTSGY